MKSSKDCYKKGGKVKSDAAQDKKMFGKMMKAKGLAKGGKVKSK